ncbi:hypothetical protein [Gilliamella apicola]|uniref:hypothetical protein n=1 Tax=Gilliamella apicola TaxID=1196095 RepID=UPI0015E8A3FA|nr:hypothetical protein [Gilliamella apicola]
MNELEQLKTIDERIAEAESLLKFLHEQRREIINRNNLNKKNEAQNAEKTQNTADWI